MYKKIKILEIGTIPETAGIGGVTVHIKRLLDWLNSDNEVDPQLYDYKKSIVSGFLIKSIIQSDLVHIHVNNPYLRIFYLYLSKLLGRKTIVTVHEEVGKYNNHKDNVVKLALKKCTVPVVLNKDSYERAKKCNKNTVVISAFIPEKVDDPLPSSIIDEILILKNRYEKLVATNSYKRVFTTTGEETYGIEFLIDFFKDKNYGVIISDPSGTYKEALTNIPSNVRIIPYPHSFFEVVKMCDIVIRNTATDGDALTVKEGLALGKFVLATDRVNRPDGVIKYKYNDSNSLEIALSRVYTGKEKTGKIVSNAAFDLKELYKERAHVENSKGNEIG